jgi:hypothetical protein
LAGSELNDPKVGEIVLVKRIFLDDGFDVLPALADGQNDPAIARYLSARDQEVTGRVVLLQELMDKFGVNVEKFGDSTGELELLSGV